MAGEQELTPDAMKLPPIIPSTIIRRVRIARPPIPRKRL
jgi:hypothetical protein